ncbi:unnamed protein product [Brugia pahangi]|uniref:C2H2-type domain-containing protein n=1 Tax=Brugia pahangi TaxID=6280 RepID=A0A0N4T984_BRUPA|nr:unnamed protein product [Brugia pahangi]
MEDQEIEVLFEYLKREPEMYRILQRFVSRAVQDGGDGVEVGGTGRAECPAMEEDPVPQEPEFNEEEAEWAPLPENENGDEAENWPSEAEWTPLPGDEEEDEPEVPGVPMEIGEPVEAVRELVLRTRTIRIPVPAMQEAIAAVPPEKELIVPQAEPYTVAQGEGNKNIVCGLCCRQFKTLKGWRIHASRTHKQDGFCARCGHYLLLPPEFTAAQRTAAMELHALDWCPRACAAVISEWQVKRRRLDLVGREEDVHHLFIPGKKLISIEEVKFKS